MGKSLEKTGKECGFQPDLLIKREIKHSKVTKYVCASINKIWESYFKINASCLGSINARYSLEMLKISGFVMKDSTTGTSLGWKCFERYNKNRELHTFTDKNVRDRIRRAIKGGRVCALNQYLESKQCEQMLHTVEKDLGMSDEEIEISSKVDYYMKYIQSKK